MPAYKKVRLDQGKELPRLEFVLKPGKTLVGKVVDEQGQPLEGVNLYFRQWKPIIEYHNFNRRAKTDTNGEFRMEHLPDGEIILGLSKRGYDIEDQIVDIERDTSVTTMKTPVVMKKSVRIYAKVVDADTGKPVKRFRVKAGGAKEFKPGDVRPYSYSFGIFLNFVTFDSDTGEFQTYEDKPGMLISLHVKAEGYADAFLPRVAFGEHDKEHPLIIRMKKELHFSGTVVDAETGKPLSDAFIKTFDKNHPLHFFGVRPDRSATEAVHSDAQGKFTLPGALAEEFYLYVTHPGRATEIVGPFHTSKPKPIRVEMQKGCVVTGTAEPGQEMWLTLAQRIPYFYSEIRTETSGQGIYRFDNLMPAKYAKNKVLDIATSLSRKQ